MTCACQVSGDETTVEVPCLLHATWAKTHAAQTWGDAHAKPLDASGPAAGGRGKSTTR